MALLTAMARFTVRKLGDLVTALFGWSVVALFGQLPRAQEVALSVALLASLFWPPALLASFLPGSFGPLVGPPSEDVLFRGTAIALALLIPFAVVAITSAASPNDEAPDRLARAALSAPSLTLGYVVACAATLVTVPLLKLRTASRGWSDTHVFVRPRPGGYHAALDAVVDACSAAGQEVREEPPSWLTAIGTRALRRFAPPRLASLAVDPPTMLCSARLEAILYSSDLLLRGEPKLVGRVRVQLASSDLERHASLVADPASQEIASQLARMWDVLARHRASEEIGRSGRARIAEIQRDLERAEIPFADWLSLDRSARRLEQALEPSAPFPGRSVSFERARAREPDASRTSTAELLRSAVEEARTLVQLEVALAKRDARAELAHAKAAVTALSVAAASGLLALAMLFDMVVLATGAQWGVALALAGALLIVAGASAFVGARALPSKPLDETRQRLEKDLQQLKERVA